MFRWSIQLPQDPREPFPNPRSEKHKIALLRLGPEFASLLCFLSIAISLPAGSCREAGFSTFNTCSILPLCRERMLSCIRRDAILQGPLIKREKCDLTNLRLHTACQSGYSAPNTQGLQCGMAQCFSCMRLNVRSQHLPTR